MRMRRSIAAFALLALMAAGVQAESENKKAKSLYDESKTETDPVKKIQGLCGAAALDAKYEPECDAIRSAFLKRQTARLNLAEDALNTRRDFKAARELAGGAVAFNAELLARKTALLARIDALQGAQVVVQHATAVGATGSTDHSSEFLAKMNADFARGDFSAAEADAQRITDPAMKAAASQKLGQMVHYNALLTQAQSAEQAGRLAEAKADYLQAQAISMNGPGDTIAHIGELEQRRAHAGPGKDTSANGPAKAPPKSAAETKANVAALLTDARQAENQAQWKTAEDKYNAVLRLDGANKDAIAGMQRVQPRMAADPEGRESILKQAIRDYYAAGFESARTSLQIYLKEQQVASRGAADFYLGATLLERWIFTTKSRKATDRPPSDAVEAFKRSRVEGYKPLPEYVSPAVLKVWDTTAM
jgi:hypothetical protein